MSLGISAAICALAPLLLNNGCVQASLSMTMALQCSLKQAGSVKWLSVMPFVLVGSPSAAPQDSFVCEGHVQCTSAGLLLWALFVLAISAHGYELPPPLNVGELLTGESVQQSFQALPTGCHISEH